MITITDIPLNTGPSVPFQLAVLRKGSSQSLPGSP